MSTNKNDEKKDAKDPNDQKDAKDANDQNDQKDAKDAKDANSQKGQKGQKKQNNANDAKSKKGKTEELKIPNTLTIYIKTRIPNYTKLLYEPYMTVPTSKSHTVYFDPLVKYIKGAIKDIPPSAPREAKYTQFFEAPQFDSLINRCISKTFNFQQKPIKLLLNPTKLLNLQKERTLTEAMEEDLINENIKLTLSTLFKRNGIFYINKRPYTIINRHWKSDSWVIDTKTENKLISPFSNVSYKDAQKEADEELDSFKKKYPVEGSSGSKNSIDDDIIDNIIKKTPNIEAQNAPPISFKDIKGSEAFEDEYYYITENFPIKFTDEHDMNTEPITFSLLFDKEVFEKFIENNKTNNIGKSFLSKYNRYWQRKEELYKKKNEYLQIIFILFI